jgi:hypothetical protein
MERFIVIKGGDGVVPSRLAGIKGAELESYVRGLALREAPARRILKGLGAERRGLKLRYLTPAQAVAWNRKAKLRPYVAVPSAAVAVVVTKAPEVVARAPREVPLVPRLLAKLKGALGF